MNKHNFHQTEVFFVTEGVNKEGEDYETTANGSIKDEPFLRELFEEFLQAAKRGTARFMISNREKETWLDTQVQTRSEDGALRYFSSFREALDFARKIDYSNINATVWEISFDLPSGERVRLVRKMLSQLFVAFT